MAEKEGTGCLWVPVLLFILVFFMPILWLAEKIQGEDSGEGAGFGTLFIAANIIITATCVVAAAVVGGGIYMWRIM